MLSLMSPASSVISLGLLHIWHLQFWLSDHVPSHTWLLGCLHFKVTHHCIRAVAPWKTPCLYQIRRIETTLSGGSEKYGLSMEVQRWTCLPQNTLTAQLIYQRNHCLHAFPPFALLPQIFSPKLEDWFGSSGSFCGAFMFGPSMGVLTAPHENN